MLRKLLLCIIGIMLVITITFGVTYAYLSVSKTQENPNTLSTPDCYEVQINEGTSKTPINITTYPMSDDKGKQNTPYEITIKNTCEANSKFQIILASKIEPKASDTSKNLMDYIKFSFDDNTVAKLNGQTTIDSTKLSPTISPEEGRTYYVIKEDYINGSNASKTYKLRLWIDQTAGNDIMGQTFTGQIIVYSEAIPTTTGS